MLVCLLCVFVYMPSLAGTLRAVDEGQPGVQLGRGRITNHYEATNRLPVVFVPGTAGSELRLSSQSPEVKDELRWVGLSALKNEGGALAPLGADGKDLDGNQVTAPNILTAVSVQLPTKLQKLLRGNLGYSPSSYELDVYANFYAWGKRVFQDRFYVAPYDWRKGAGEESSRIIDEVVDKALKETGQGQVVLIAHSLGGLVSRDYIARLGQKKVAALVAVGTPWLGTPKAARALLLGYNFDVGIVDKSNDRVRIQGLPGSFVTDVCANSQCQYLYRASFLKREDVRELAKNYPCVYQQLPTNDFMLTYGQHYFKDKRFRSVIWGKDTWDEVERFYRDENNAGLYGAAQRWRQEYLNGQDYGVSHYLIGGIYSPECGDPRNKDKNCKVENRMDMQMAQDDQIEYSGVIKKRVRSISLLDLAASLIDLNVYEDRFIATDSGYEWGDGTSPLLSATAGEYVRYIKGNSEPQNRGSAQAYLGKDTNVEAVVLGSKYAHSAMLDDPQVREKILSIYRKENGDLAMALPPSGEEVDTIRIELEAEDNRNNNIVVIQAVDGSPVVQSRFLRTSLSTTFDGLRIYDPAIKAPREYGQSIGNSVTRKLMTTDLPGRKLTLLRRMAVNETGGDLVITKVSVFVNDKLYLKDETSFVLETRVPKEISFPGL
jgi:pimeloyl-ACP methyl ester carboxylesterase